MALEKIDMLPRLTAARRDAFFVFDEPSGSLDNHFRDLFLDLLFDRFRRRPFTALVVTHDYSMISRVTQAAKTSSKGWNSGNSLVGARDW